MNHTPQKENVIILMGQVKNFDPLADLFKTQIHQNLHQNCEYILLTSQQKTYTNPRQNENHQIDYTSILKHINFAQIIYDELEKEESTQNQTLRQLNTYLNNTYGGAYDEHSILSTYNSLKLLYSLHLLYHTLQSQNKHYNKYILLRSDIHHDTAFNPEWLKNPEDAIIPLQSSWGGYNDRYAILNEKAFTSYCSRYQKIYHYPQKLHAESYLKQTLDQDNITVKQPEEIRFRLLRSDGTLTSKEY